MPDNYILVVTQALVVSLMYMHPWPQACGPRAVGVVCIYQANYSCPCYNYYIKNFASENIKAKNDVISLSTVVLNSRDRQGNLWLP